MTHMADQMAFESCVQEALRLRAAWSEAGVDFFQYLVQWELDESKWKRLDGEPTGYGTFAEVLHATNIAKVHRLVRFKEIVARFGLEKVRAIGIEAAEEAFKIPDHVPSRREPEILARDAAVRDLCEFRTRNHTTPSTMTARSIERKHYEPPPKEREDEQSYDDRVKELERENAQLKKELAAKDREIAKLKKALATAEAVPVPPMAKSARRRAPRAEA